MASKGSNKHYWLSELTNRADAQKAMKGGAFAAWFVAAINIGIGALIMFAAPGLGKSVGLTGAAMIDGVIFAVIGISIWRYSFIGAWVGLAFFSLEKIYQWTTQPKSLTGLALAAAILLAFINAVRGAMALRRFKREEAALAISEAS
ncbi:hypothetical protein [Luteibacter aegosomatissinici]|uniref:hypothetical protein n=1 Tax=Luteibacter aegosomatissinici TaxID=2911539 RepID=UPI001FF76561|nr:hypothetical protein [Luteibacter aegosomatissinici]UPG95745.1 hypothetical protein L2Y97_06460 [Luteibacter aegosomatissinici]